MTHRITGEVILIESTQLDLVTDFTFDEIIYILQTIIYAKSGNGGIMRGVSCSTLILICLLSDQVVLAWPTNFDVYSNELTPMALQLGQLKIKKMEKRHFWGLAIGAEYQ